MFSIVDWMDYQESFYNYLKYEKRFSSHTVIAYRNDLHQFIEFHIGLKGKFDPVSIGSKNIRDWVVKLMDEKLLPRSVHRKVTTLKAFFKFLMKEQVVESNPVMNMPLPRIRKKLPVFVEEASLNHLLDDGMFKNDFSGIRDKLVISLLYGTGIRLSELTGLKEEDINSREGQIKVLGKRNKERIVPFPQSLNPLISEYRDLKAEQFGISGGTLLVTDKGMPVYPRMVYRIVRNYLSLVTSVEKRSPHIIRHSYATHLLNKGADLNAVKELLGHSNLAATQIYTHTIFERLQTIYKQAHPRG